VSRTVLPRALQRPQRAFSTSLPVRRVVATNPVKAEEVKVYLPSLIPPLHSDVSPSPGLQASIPLSSTSMMLSSCE